MKKLLVVVLALLLATGLVCLVGCGDSGEPTETEVEVDRKRVEVDRDAEEGEISIETSEGEVTYSTKDVDEADIGVPIYPGAKMVEGAEGYSAETEAGQITAGGAMLVTKDSYDDVVEWYEDKLSGMSNYYKATVPDGTSIAYQDGGSMKSVVIAEGEDMFEGMTTIAVAAVSGYEIPEL